MSDLTAPDYGAEKITLKAEKGRYKIQREVWTDHGQSSFYDASTKDFVTWRGTWQTIQTLGTFETPAEAREFMIAREQA